jgi:very-short-patch-repair endonuclease
MSCFSAGPDFPRARYLAAGPEEGRHVTHSIAPRDDPYPSSRQPQKMNAVLGYALIDVMIKSDPEAQRLLTMVESPLERVWLSVWYPMRDRDVVVEPQKQVGPYRVDFLIEDQLVVELDGYLYHRASRDQLIKDYKRDRYFAARGYTVMRFSGYEVWDDPWQCAAEVDTYVQDLEEARATLSSSSRTSVGRALRDRRRELEAQQDSPAIG